MGNIRPYGGPKGRNHVGIYLFETINEQNFSASADLIEKVSLEADGAMRHPFPS